MGRWAVDSLTPATSAMNAGFPSECSATAASTRSTSPRGRLLDGYESASAAVCRTRPNVSRRRQQANRRAAGVAEGRSPLATPETVVSLPAMMLVVPGVGDAGNHRISCRSCGLRPASGPTR